MNFIPRRKQKSRPSPQTVFFYSRMGIKLLSTPPRHHTPHHSHIYTLMHNRLAHPNPLPHGSQAELFHPPPERGFLLLC